MPLLLPLHSQLIQLSRQRATASKVLSKRARKDTALLSDLEVSDGDRADDEDDEDDDEDDEDDDVHDNDKHHGKDKSSGMAKGPLSAEARMECEALGAEIERKAQALARKYGKSPSVILRRASLEVSFSRKCSTWNMHQAWFYATQMKEGGERRHFTASIFS